MLNRLKRASWLYPGDSDYNRLRTSLVPDGYTNLRGHWVDCLVFPEFGNPQHCKWVAERQQQLAGELNLEVEDYKGWRYFMCITPGCYRMFDFPWYFEEQRCKCGALYKQEDGEPYRCKDIPGSTCDTLDTAQMTLFPVSPAGNGSAG